MKDYTFEYAGDSFRVPKNKIFECICELVEIVPLAEVHLLTNRGEAVRSASLFCVLGSYANKVFEPMEIAQQALHGDQTAGEILISISGIIGLLNPPESYHPPESEPEGK